ncbi:MAG TPA: hypothetical protein VNU93_04175, partial [Verrucomicrobiae bacterium]|nr:hypothetical protein [Verrucomicrobiae bacterium]
MFSVLSILLTIATLAFIAYPLVRGKELNQYPDKDLQANNLKTHKETIMTTLGEIEFDYHMRKLSEEDY